MATATTAPASTLPVQPMLPFDVDAEIEAMAESVSPPAIYDEVARAADRELCQCYFTAWCGSFGHLDGSTAAGHPAITRAEFETAAERLAQPVN